MNIYDNEEFFAAYADMPRSSGLKQAGEWHQLEPLFPPLAGIKMLDLGCGYGWQCRYAAEKGASVVGIDQSERMLAAAVVKNAHEQIRYHLCSITEYEYPAGEFDLVFSNLALHYIEDLDGIYEKVYRTLKPGGTFLFNIEHPIFTAGVGQEWITENGETKYWPVDDYYYPGKRETVFLGQKVEKQHHTLTQILNGLLRQGFTLEAVEEAMPAEADRHLPWMKDEMRRPMMLLVKAEKQ